MRTKDLIMLGAGFAAGRLSKKANAGFIGATSKDSRDMKYVEVMDKIRKKYPLNAKKFIRGNSKIKDLAYVLWDHSEGRNRIKKFPLIKETNASEYNRQYYSILNTHWNKARLDGKKKFLRLAKIYGF